MPAIGKIIYFIIGILVLVIAIFIIYLVSQLRAPTIPYPIDPDTAYALTSTAALTCAIDFVAEGKEDVASCYNKLGFDILGKSEEEEKVLTPFEGGAAGYIVNCERVGSFKDDIYFRCRSIYKQDVNVKCSKSGRSCTVIRFTLPQQPNVQEWLVGVIKFISSAPILNYFSSLITNFIDAGDYWVGFTRAFAHPKFIVMYEKLDQGIEDWWKPRDEPIEWAVASIMMGGALNVLPLSKAGFSALKVTFKHGFTSLFKKELREEAKKIIKTAWKKALLEQYGKVMGTRLFHATEIASETTKIFKKTVLEEVTETFSSVYKKITGYLQLDLGGGKVLSLKEFPNRIAERTALFIYDFAEKGMSKKFTETELKNILLREFENSLNDLEFEAIKSAFPQVKTKREALEIIFKDKGGLNKVIDDSFEKIFKENYEGLNRPLAEAIWEGEVDKVVQMDKNSFTKKVLRKLEKDPNLLKNILSEKTIEEISKRQKNLFVLYNSDLLSKAEKKNIDAILKMVKGLVSRDMQKFSLLRIQLTEDGYRELVQRIAEEAAGNLENFARKVKDAYELQRITGTWKYFYTKTALTTLGAFEGVPLDVPLPLWHSCLDDFLKVKSLLKKATKEAFECAESILAAAAYANALYLVTDYIFSEPYEGCGGNSMCLWTNKFIVFHETFNITNYKKPNIFVAVTLPNMDWFGLANRYNRAWLVSPCETDLVVEYSDASPFKCEEFVDSNKFKFKVNYYETPCACGKFSRSINYQGITTCEDVGFLKCEKYNNTHYVAYFKVNEINGECPTYEQLTYKEKETCGYNTNLNISLNSFRISIEKQPDDDIIKEVVGKYYEIDVNNCKRYNSFVDCAKDLVYNIIKSKCNNNLDCYAEKIDLITKSGNIIIEPVNLVTIDGLETTISSCTSSWTTGWLTGSQIKSVVITPNFTASKQYFLEKVINMDLAKENKFPYKNYCVPNGGKIENTVKNVCEIGTIAGSVLLTVFTGGVGGLAASFIMGSLSETCGFLTAGTNIWPTNQFSI